MQPPLLIVPFRQQNPFAQIQVVILFGVPIEIEKVSPAEDVLHADGDQAPVFDLRFLGSFGQATVLILQVLDLRLTITSTITRIRCRGGWQGDWRKGMQPERHRLRWPFSCGQFFDAAGILQGLAYGGLLSRCGGRMFPRKHALFQMGSHQALIAGKNAGKILQSPEGQALVLAEPGLLFLMVAHPQGRQPEIEIPIELGAGEKVDERGQAQRLFITPGQSDLFGFVTKQQFKELFHTFQKQ